jgi:hypothetical protein
MLRRCSGAVAKWQQSAGSRVLWPCCGAAAVLRCAAWRCSGCGHNMVQRGEAARQRCCYDAMWRRCCSTAAVRCCASQSSAAMRGRCGGSAVDGKCGGDAAGMLLRCCGSAMVMRSCGGAAAVRAEMQWRCSVSAVMLLQCYAVRGGSGDAAAMRQCGIERWRCCAAVLQCGFSELAATRRPRCSGSDAAAMHAKHRQVREEDQPALL